MNRVLSFPQDALQFRKRPCTDTFVWRGVFLFFLFFVIKDLQSNGTDGCRPRYVCIDVLKFYFEVVPITMNVAHGGYDRLKWYEDGENSRCSWKPSIHQCDVGTFVFTFNTCK